MIRKKLIFVRLLQEPEKKDNNDDEKDSEKDDALEYIERASRQPAVTSAFVIRSHQQCRGWIKHRSIFEHFRVELRLTVLWKRVEHIVRLVVVMSIL